MSPYRFIFFSLYFSREIYIFRIIFTNKFIFINHKCKNWKILFQSGGVNKNCNFRSNQTHSPHIYSLNFGLKPWDIRPKSACFKICNLIIKKWLLLSFKHVLQTHDDGDFFLCNKGRLVPGLLHMVNKNNNSTKLKKKKYFSLYVFGAGCEI